MENLTAKERTRSIQISFDTSLLISPILRTFRSDTGSRL